MMNERILKMIDASVLCWLATSSSDNFPNVSPKEVFCAVADNHIIIANIASPGSIKNIKENNKVCISFIDILVQKGFQLKGYAEIIDSKDTEYESLKKPLEKITGGRFPFSSITKVTVESSKEILAPSYILFPETTEESQIENAKRYYFGRNN